MCREVSQAVICLCSGGVPRASSSSLPSPDEAPPSRLRGSGQKEEVILRGGVCRLRKGEEPVGSERRPLGVVQFWEKYKNGSRVFKASERRKGSGDSAGRETGPGRAGSAFCGLEKRARAEGKAGKGLQEVCRPSAG